MASLSGIGLSMWWVSLGGMKITGFKKRFRIQKYQTQKNTEIHNTGEILRVSCLLSGVLLPRGFIGITPSRVCWSFGSGCDTFNCENVLSIKTGLSWTFTSFGLIQISIIPCLMRLLSRGNLFCLNGKVNEPKKRVGICTAPWYQWRPRVEISSYYSRQGGGFPCRQLGLWCKFPGCPPCPDV